MPRKPIMTPATLNTILNSAPMILQGAGRLFKMIRERRDEAAEQGQDLPATVDGLRQEVRQIESRLIANDESDLQQIQLIEQLARQNEALAESLRKTLRHLGILTWLSGTALLLAAAALILVFTS